MQEVKQEKIIQILIVGEGGDGIKILGNILADAAFSLKLVPENKCDYTPAARGGECVTSLVIASQKPLYPLVTQADFIFVFHNQILGSKLVKHKITDKTTILSIDPEIPNDLPPNIKPEIIKIIERPENEPANIFMLKIIQKTVQEMFPALSAESVEKATQDTFKKK